MISARVAAAQALGPVLAGRASLAATLPAVLSEVAAADRALAQELVYGSARWYPRLAAILRVLLRKPFKAADRDLEALLAVGLYQLLYTRIPAHAALSETVGATVGLGKPWARALVNAVLRNWQRRADELLPELARQPEAHWAHPQWLLRALRADWPEDWEAICTANNAKAPLTLRVNLQRVSRDDYLQHLQDAGLEAELCTLSAAGLRLARACDVTQLPGFEQGWVSVQDEAAQLAAPLLQLEPGLRVLDACCAPGGKTCHLLELEPCAEVWAVELEAERMARVESSLARLGLSATLRVADVRDLASWWDGQPFQRILLDAPCSATGVIRHHPDIKLTRQAGDIAALAALQAELLSRMWSILAPGGILLYATCSVFHRENRNNLDAFLASTPDARWLPLTEGADRGDWALLPGTWDGFYYARLTKTAAQA